jgi:exodeoxyribonuclease VII small subunit
MCFGFGSRGYFTASAIGDPLPWFERTRTTEAEEVFPDAPDLTAAPQIDYFYTFPRRVLRSRPPFMTKSPKSSPSDPQPSFEEALAELEKIVARMESGKLTLEQSLESHRRGIELAQLCQSFLARAQQQVKVLEEGALKDFTIDTRDDDEPAR